jgi:hypothetical protein
LDREASWRLVATVPLRFNAHHPQGMVQVGRTILSDRGRGDTGNAKLPEPRPVGSIGTKEQGSATCSSSVPRGERLSDLRIGEGSIYHPGGIDYDGRHIWIPVAEYRPNSRSIVYRVDPAQGGDRKAVEGLPR